MEYKYKFLFDLNEKVVEEAKDFYRKSIWSLAVPSIFHLLFASVAAVFLLKIAEGISVEAIASVSAGQRISLSFVVLLVGLGAVTTTFVGKAFGEKNTSKVAQSFRACLLSSFVVGLLCMSLILLLKESLASFFSLEGQAKEQAIEFLSYVAFVAPAQALFFILTSAYRAIGDAKTPFWFASMAHVFSIIAAYTLAFGKFGMPALGVKGIAIGWAGILILATLVFFLYWLLSDSQLPFSCDHSPPPMDWRKFFSIAIPATIEPLANQFSMVIYSALVATYGVAAFASFGIGINIFVIIISIGSGFSMAAAAVVVKALGANDKVTAVKSAYYAMRAAFGLAFFISLVFFVLAEPIAALVIQEPEAQKITVSLLYVLAFIQPVMVADYVMVGAIRGAGDGKFPMKTIIISNIYIRLPLACLIVYFSFPVEVLFCVFILDVFVKFGLVLPRFRSKSWALG